MRDYFENRAFLNKFAILSEERPLYTGVTGFDST